MDHVTPPNARTNSTRSGSLPRARADRRPFRAVVPLLHTTAVSGTATPTELRQRRPHRTADASGARSRGPTVASRTSTYERGIEGEDIVATELGRRGWSILARRARFPTGEIDIVARRGGTISFVEVKTAGVGRVDVEHAVSYRARMRIRRAAVAWIASHPRDIVGVRSYRFDVQFVHLHADGELDRIEQVTNAF